MKLVPTNVDAWNALGHCYWKRGDLQQAVSCFAESRAVNATPVALHSLSMLKRQMMTNSLSGQQIQEAIEASVTLAKEAVQLDVSNSQSWCEFPSRSDFGGNVMLPTVCLVGSLSLNRCTGQCVHITVLPIVKKCRGCQQGLEGVSHGGKRSAAACTLGFLFSSPSISHQHLICALQDAKGGSANPDLFFNRGKVERYLQEYTAAIASFTRAASIDPGLGAESQANDALDVDRPNSR